MNLHQVHVHCTNKKPASPAKKTFFKRSLFALKRGCFKKLVRNYEILRHLTRRPKWTNFRKILQCQHNWDISSACVLGHFEISWKSASKDRKSAKTIARSGYFWWRQDCDTWGDDFKNRKSLDIQDLGFDQASKSLYYNPRCKENTNCWKSQRGSSLNLESGASV